MQARRVSLTTLGCKLNHAETSSLERDFTQRGWTVVPFGDESDLIVVNTCSVTENADTECRKIVRRGLRASPLAQVAVTGCYAQLKPDVVASIPGVTSVFGSAEKSSIPMRFEYELVDPSSSSTPLANAESSVSDLSNASFQFARTADTSSRTRAFVKLQDGCDYGCTFCTIPLARGAARAMSMDDIRTELISVQARGYSEAVLTGINLGEYEHNGTNESAPHRFIDVLRMIADMRPSFRVRISSIEPNTLTAGLIDVLASSSVFCPHVHVPLQSGSADVLKMMRRRYNPTMYRNTIEHVVERIADCSVGIDVIVGFPGETDAHFEESYAFVESLPFSYLHVFTYSERSNTPAAEYPGRIPMRIRRERTARLRALSAEREHAFAQRMVGTTRIVIPEGFDAKTKLNNGLTDNYIRVHIKSDVALEKQPLEVEITEVTEAHVFARVTQPNTTAIAHTLVHA